MSPGDRSATVIPRHATQAARFKPDHGQRERDGDESNEKDAHEAESKRQTGDMYDRNMIVI